MRAQPSQEQVQRAQGATQKHVLTLVPVSISTLDHSGERPRSIVRECGKSTLSIVRESALLLEVPGSISKRLTYDSFSLSLSLEVTNVMRHRVHMCIRMYVCMYACMHICMHARQAALDTTSIHLGSYHARAHTHTHTHKGRSSVPHACIVGSINFPPPPPPPPPPRSGSSSFTAS